MSDETTRSPVLAPEYALHRVETAADSLPQTSRAAGINMRSYTHAHVQVVPSGGANPLVKIMFWSPEAGKFIDLHTALTFTAGGLNTAWETTVECRGREMFVAVTGGVTSGQVKIFVAGYSAEQV
jgi:hypothetical protein